MKDKDITAYTRADANKFRDALIERGLLGSSITRIMGTVRAVINFAASELGVTIKTPSRAFTMTALLASKIVNLCRWTSCESYRPCVALPMMMRGG